MNTNCPHCRKPLTIVNLVGLYSIYCAHGDCPSDACNQGATRPTVDEAMLAIESAYEREMTVNPKALK